MAERLRNNDVQPRRNDNFGKHVADELNNMSPDMLLYVKKLINMAIFEGQMKSLNASSSIVTQQSFPLQQPPPLPHNHHSTSQLRNYQLTPLRNFASFQPHT